MYEIGELNAKHWVSGVSLGADSLIRQELNVHDAIIPDFYTVVYLYKACHHKQFFTLPGILVFT